MCLYVLQQLEEIKIIIIIIISLWKHMLLLLIRNGSDAYHYEDMPIQIHWKFYYQKKENFQIKNSDIFHISAQNINCGYPLEPPRRGGSNEYPQSMFLSRKKKKNNVYPCKPQFYYIKVGFKGSKLYRHVFVMANIILFSYFSTYVLRTCTHLKHFKSFSYFSTKTYTVSTN